MKKRILSAFLVFMIFTLIITSCGGKSAEKKHDDENRVTGGDTTLTSKDAGEQQDGAQIIEPGDSSKLVDSAKDNGEQQNSIQDGMQIIEFNNSNILMDMAIDEKSKEGTIYVADKKSIYVYDNKSGKWDSVVDNLESCRIIAVDGGKIFALDDGSSTLKYFDSKGVLIKEYPVDKGYGQKLLCIGDKVILHFVDSKSGNWYIAVYDINTGEKTMLEFDNIESFTRYKKDSVLLILKSDELVIYDIKKMEVSEKYYMLIPVIGIVDICYDPDDNSLYFACGKDIEKMNIDSKVAEKIYNDDEAWLKNARIHNNMLIFSNTLGKQVYKIDKNSTPKYTGSTINIALMDNYSIEGNKPIKRAMDIYKQKNPGHQFCFQVYGDNNLFLMTKLMSGQVDDIGMIFMSSMNMPESLIINDFFYDLNNRPGIVEKFNLMFDGVKDSLSCDGKIFGVPFRVYTDAWKINTELMDTLKLNYPKENWTWDDFYLYAREARRDLNGNGKADTYIAELEMTPPFFMYQYNSIYFDVYRKTADYNTEEFINLLKLWKKIYKEDLVENTSHNKEKDYILFMDKYQRFNTSIEDDTYICMPTLKSKRIYHSYIDFFMVNKKSKNLNECLDFLEIYLSDEVQRIHFMNGFYKERSFYNLDEAVAYFLEINSYKAEPPEYKLTCSDNFNLLNTILKYSKPFVFRLELNQGFIPFCIDYYDDKITAEEAAALISKNAQMIVGE